MNKLEISERRDIMRHRPEWSNIANDIIMSRVQEQQGATSVLSLQDICEAYGLTITELNQTLALTEFQRLFAESKQRIEALGDNAALTLRATVIAAEVLEEGYRRIMSKESETKDVLKFVEMTMKYAGFDPTVNKNNKESVNTGAINTVIINVPPGIPGMEHIYETASRNVIEVIPDE